MKQTLLLLVVLVGMALLAARAGASYKGLVVKASPETPVPILFQEAGANAGIHGTTICGGSEKTAVIEINGSGACWLDYNRDGWLDLYVVNGSTLQELRTKEVGAHQGGQSYLYKNNGNGTFTELAESAGVPGHAWGTACAAADFDNDGWTDLFVANIGGCFLYRNLGDGTFREISQKAGVRGTFNWYTGVTFGDYDGDGWLDVYVAAYVDPSEVLKEQKICQWRGVPVYCGPPGMKGASDTLFHNNGDGTFSDVTRLAGVEERQQLFGFTAIFEDFDNDNKPDIFVANDRGRNYLYKNLGNGKFQEVAELWGVAYPIEGAPQANMGVAIGDYDRNGTMDIFVTTFAEEHFTLFKNLGNHLFNDVSSEAGIAEITLPYLGWGTFFADLDNDGSLDLFMVNGHVYPQVDRVGGFKQTFAQRALLFRQSAPSSFTEIGMSAGLGNLKMYSSRGATYADFDNDGDLDILYTNLDAPPTLLKNVSSNRNHWITLKLVGTRSNRDGIGARLRMKAGDLVQYASVRSGESYLSGNDPRVHFGLGNRKQIDELEIRWPSGQTDRLSQLDIDQIQVIQEGRGFLKDSTVVVFRNQRNED